MDSGTLHDALRAFQEVDVAITHDELIIHRRECLEIAKQNILDAQQRQKEIYDQKHVCPPTFHLGAQVLKKDFTRKWRLGGKLDSKWIGPYSIVANLGKGLFRLQKVDDPTQF